MPRFFAEILEDGTALIQGRDAAHIAGPLRMRGGEELPIRVQDQGYRAKLLSITPKKVILEIIEPQELFDRGTRRIHLAVSMLPPADMDEIIRFTAELGVTTIIPVITGRSNIRIINDARYQRWHDIILETLKITQRRSIPLVHPITSLEYFITQHSSTWPRRCVGLQHAATPLANIDDQELGILIGPEGGFDSEEEELLHTAGFTPVTMGQTNMRAVTAAIAAVSILAGSE